MKKIVCLTSLIALSASIASADFNTSDNMSVKQQKTGNRNASTSVEAAFYNPAGLPWGLEDGLVIEFSQLPSYQKDSIQVKYQNTAFGTTPNVRDDYEMVKGALFLPALNFAYKKNNWVGFVNIGLAKGGGTGETEKGLPSFDRAARGVLIGGAYSALAALGDPNALVNAVAAVDNPALVDIQSDGKGTLGSLGILFGGAYAFNEKVSLGGGLRFAYQKSATEATINTKNISGNPGLDGLNNKIEVEYEEIGNCFGAFLALDVRPTEKLLIANTIKYHGTLELEADVIKDGGVYAPLLQGGGYIPTDGATYEATYAPQWSLGLAYQVTPKLLAEFDYDIFFLSMVDDNRNSDHYDDISHNVGLGAEYQMTEKMNVGLGFTYGIGSGLIDTYQSDLEYDVPQLWLNSGVSYKFKPNFEVSLAGQLGVALEDADQTSTATFDPSNPAATAAYLAYTETYEVGTAMSLALGISYHF